jgi:hypothetical protein
MNGQIQGSPGLGRLLPRGIEMENGDCRPMAATRHVRGLRSQTPMPLGLPPERRDRWLKRVSVILQGAEAGGTVAAADLKPQRCSSSAGTRGNGPADSQPPLAINSSAFWQLPPERSRSVRLPCSNQVERPGARGCSARKLQTRLSGGEADRHHIRMNDALRLNGKIFEMSQFRLILFSKSPRATSLTHEILRNSSP